MDGLVEELLNAIDAHVALINGDGAIQAVNAAWRRFARDNGGAPDRTGVGVNYFQACTGPEAERAVEGIRDVLSGRRDRFELEYPCDAPTERLWFKMSVLALEQRPGAIIVHSSVTATRLLELALSEHNQLLELVARDAPREELLTALVRYVEARIPRTHVAILLDDLGHGARLASALTLPSEVASELCHLVDHSSAAGADNAKARESVLIADLAGDAERATQLPKAVAAGIRACWSFPLPTKTAGSNAAFAVCSRDLGTPSGSSSEIILSAVRLTAYALEREADRAELRASEERFRLLVDGVRDHALFLVSAAGTIISWNSGAERVFGASARDAVGANVRVFSTDEGAAEDAAALLRAIEQGHYQTYGSRRRKDGSVFLAHVLITAIRPGHGDTLTFGVLVRDLSELNALEDQLRHAQRMDAIGQLAGGVAHDFNNLLTVINACSLMLKDGLSAQPALAELADEVLQAGSRAAALTRQLLAFGRRNILTPVIFDLASLLPRIESLLRRLIGEDILVTISLEPPVPLVRADVASIEQVIINLCVNARDAMPHGGRLTIRACGRELLEVLVTDTGPVDAGSYAEITVTDEGHGIDEHVRKRMFEPFFSTKSPAKGTGLGLAVAYGAIKQSGGGILVESQLGRGTTIRVLLPEASGAGGVESVTSSPPRVGPTSGVVLLVEDDASVRRLVRRMLEDAGMVVIEASSGEEALASASQSAPDLVLTDVVMPNMSGPVLAQRLRERYPAVPVLFMSGYNDDLLLRHGVETGRDSTLQKPFSRESLIERVTALMAVTTHT